MRGVASHASGGHAAVVSDPATTDVGGCDLFFILIIFTTVAEPVHHVPQQSSHVSARVQPTVCSYNGGCTHTNKLKCVMCAGAA